MRVGDSGSVGRARHRQTYFTVREVAEELRTTTQAIYRRIRRGTLPCVRDGRRVLVPVAAVDAALRPERRLGVGPRGNMSSGLRGLREEPRMHGNDHHTTTWNTRTNFFSIRAGSGRARYTVDFYLFLQPGQRPKNIRRRSPFKSKPDTQAWARQMLPQFEREHAPAPTNMDGPYTVAEVCSRWMGTQTRDMKNKSRYMAWLERAWGEETLIADVSHEQIVGLPALLSRPLGPRASKASRRRRPAREGRARRRKGEGLSEASARQVCQAANRVLAFAAAMGWRSEAKVPLPVVPIMDAEWLTIDELRTVLEGAGRWRLAIMLGARAGLRRGEICELRWGDVDLRQGKIRVARAYKVKDGTGPGREWHVSTCKGREARTVTVPPDLVAELKNARQARGELVVQTEAGGRVMPWALSEVVPAIAKRVGVHRPGLGVHALRHTFCSHLALGGAPMKAIQILAGHKSPRTTERYMHLSPTHVEAAISCLPALELAAGDETRTKLDEEAPEFGG